VRSNVNRELSFGAELLLAELALEFELVRVNCHMALERARAVVVALANGAFVDRSFTAITSLVVG
jgi:hypothetical protein